MDPVFWMLLGGLLVGYPCHRAWLRVARENDTLARLVDDLDAENQRLVRHPSQRHLRSVDGGAR